MDGFEWLGEIERRAEAATPGPWPVADRWNSSLGHPPGTSWKVGPMFIFSQLDGQANAQFVGRARTDVPRLCRAVRELAEALGRVLASQWFDLPDPLRDEANGVLERWKCGGD